MDVAVPSASAAGPSTEETATSPTNSSNLKSSTTSEIKKLEKRPSKRTRVDSSATEDREKSSNSTSLPAILDKNAPATLPSCTECKRRKVKCDRKVPCSACIRRDAPETCQWHWNDGQIDPVIALSKLTADIETLQDRLLKVEVFLHTLPQDIRALAPPFGVIQQQQKPTPIAGPSSTTLPPNFKEADNVDDSNTSSSNMYHTSPQNIVGFDSIFRSPAQTSFAVPRLSTGFPPASQGGSSKSTQELEYDAAAENAAIYLESFANQGPRGEESQTPVSPQNQLDTSPASHNISWQDMELTEALTSIKVLPARLQSQDTHLSWYPHHVDGQKATSSRSQALQEIFSYLPTMVQMEYLTNLFEEKVHWRFAIVHLPAFRVEVKRLWEMIASGRQLEVDPLWLGVVFMVLALSLSSRPATNVDPSDPFQGLSMEQLGALASGFHATSLKALHIGDCMGKPRPRTVQAVCLFAVYQQQFLQAAAGLSGERMLHWLSIGIRSAQMMGLHSLGSDPEVMPPDDPCWPAGKNTIKRQMGLRLWANLQWADWMSATSSARSYSIHPSYCTSQMVANLNEWELSATEWKVQPHPPNVITTTAFQVTVWHIANILRLTYDKVVTNASTFSYDTVLELDREYQKMLDELPLLADDADESKLPEKVYMQRHIALIGTHSRIARLHRPYLSRGYTPGSKYSYSKDRCLWSAGIMVQCHAKVQQITSRGIFWFAYSHTLNAAMVLFLDLLWSIDNDLPISQLVEKRKMLLKIQKIFSDYENIGNQSLREMVELSNRIISGLLQECSARQTARVTALFNAVDDTPSEKPEPFASLLRRVSLALQKEQERKTAAQPMDTGNQHSQMQPAIIGADSASFSFLLDPLTYNNPLHAPLTYNTYQPQNALPTDETNSVIASNFAGINGFDDLFEMGNNDRYNFNLWNFPTNQATTGSYAQDPSGEETSQILRQLMGFEPSYQNT